MSTAAKNWKQRFKLGVKRILIHLEMASLQSSRTQCCCCAIGVVAAMFGVFMLSAGICIVVNVGMEVDTSGLPSNLHNDDGRRIVGIILICVAATMMALSASVGIIYFVLCNNKPLPSKRGTPAAVGVAGRKGEDVTDGAKPADGNKPHGHHHHHHGRHLHGANQPRLAGNTAAQIRLTAQERTRSRDSVRTGSQQSLRSSASSSGGGVLVDQSPGAGAGVRPGGSRYHHKRSHKHKSRGFRPGLKRYQHGLEPHMEEDVEAAKSLADLRKPDIYVSAADGTATPVESEDGHLATGDELDRASSSASTTHPPITTSNTDLHGERLLQRDAPSPIMSDDGSVEHSRLVGEGSVATMENTLDGTINNFLREYKDSTADTTADFQDSRRLSTETDETMLTTEVDSFLYTEGDHNAETTGASNLNKDHTIPVLAPVNQFSTPTKGNNRDAREDTPPRMSSTPQSRGVGSSPPYTEPSLPPRIQQPGVPSTSSLSSASSLSISSSQSSSVTNLRQDDHRIIQVEPETSQHAKGPHPLSSSAEQLGQFSERNESEVGEGPKRKSKNRRLRAEQDSPEAVELEPQRSHRRKRHHHHRHHKHDNNNEVDSASALPPLPHRSSKHLPQPDITTETSDPVQTDHRPPVPQPRYNPAFSSDGGDPDPEETSDLRKMQQYMEEIMKDQTSEV